ncbi:MAG: DUF5686 family protein, partial [Ferruginibacter sp.]
ILKQNTVTEEVLVLNNARVQNNNYWDTARLEQLTKSESSIYKMMDTIQHLPAYKRYYNTLYFLGTGYKNIGKIQIGPWLSWISGNALEGTRIRFDLGTNKKFSKDLYLHGYLAYGFADNRWKQNAEAIYFLNHKLWQNISVSFKNDLDFSQNYNSTITTDNALATAFRKANIPIKFINLKQTKIQYFKDTKIGLSFNLSFANKAFDPLLNLPSKTIYTSENNITTSEVGIKIRFGYLEKFYENNFFRYSLGSSYPTPELEFVQGVKNIFDSKYEYHKLKLSVGQTISIAPLGKINYYVSAGKVWGTLPYILLELPPGNEVHFYNKYAFNLMNRYEYVTDRFATVSVEHNVGNGLFRFIPLTRKLKFRQFWNAKAVVGNLTNANKIYNQLQSSTVRDLNGSTYAEVGTGVENIFKLFRIDFVWRLSPTPLPQNLSSRFGIFGSFKIQL